MGPYPIISGFGLRFMTLQYEFKSDWGIYQGWCGTGFETNGPLKGSWCRRHAFDFFPTLLDNIGDDIVKAVLSCLNSKTILLGLNHTFITLIPKVKSLEYVIEFRPIALWNILYKLVSKVLANWLKRVLPQIISESQSAFQSDKAISGNILVAFETLHHMKMKKTGKIGHMVLKLDISKVYDRLEWIFLQRIMEKKGFHPTWIGWIMECISSVTYSILVNRELKGHITPTNLSLK